MKRFGRIAAVMWVIGAPALFASVSDFDFTVDTKLQDKSESVKDHTQIKDESWAYTVLAQNKSARDYSDLEIRYIVFRKEAIPGSKSGGYKVERAEGSVKAGAIKAHGDYSFSTNAVHLIKSQLQGSWVYKSGAPVRRFDSLEGLWIRVYSGGKQIAEFTSPQGLDQKELWDAPTQ